MAHPYTKVLVHCVFSTKERRKLIHPELQTQLFPYLGGIARTNGMTCLAAGGTEDHVHLLLALSATLPIAKAVQLIKGGSSKWVHEICPELSGFSWQEDYGAFTIGISQLERTRAYIHRQIEHHRVLTFEEEFIQFLSTHGTEYDPRHVWG